MVAKDRPKGKGRKPVDARLVLDTLIHRLRSGCQWNHLAGELADDKFGPSHLAAVASGGRV
jgi:hypothetical protein